MCPLLPTSILFLCSAPPVDCAEFLASRHFPSDSEERRGAGSLPSSFSFFRSTSELYHGRPLRLLLLQDHKRQKEKLFPSLPFSFLLLLPPFPLPSHIFLAVPSSSVRLPCPKFNAVGGEGREGQEKGGGGGAEDQPGGDGSRRREGEKERKFFLPFLFHVLRASSTLFCQFDVFPWERATSCTNVAGVQHPVFQHGCCSLVSLPPFFKRVFYCHRRRREMGVFKEKIGFLPRRTCTTYYVSACSPMMMKKLAKIFLAEEVIKTIPSPPAPPRSSVRSNLLNRLIEAENFTLEGRTPPPPPHFLASLLNGDVVGR